MKNVFLGVILFLALFESTCLLTGGAARASPSGSDGNTIIKLMAKATYTNSGWLFFDSYLATNPWLWDNEEFPKLSIGTETFPFHFNSTTPSITGPISMTLNEGYVLTSSGTFTVNGVPAPKVTTSGDTNITWDSINKTLKITEGLTAGIYPVILTASNGVSPDVTLTFTLVVDTPVTRITLDKNAVTLNIGDFLQLTETVLPSNTANKSVTWSSSNTSVATVTNGGMTAVSTGTAIITVTTAKGGHTANCNVTVQPVSVSVPVTGVVLNKNKITLAPGASETLIATVMPAYATNKEVTWSTACDGTIAAVCQKGTVTANNIGKVGSMMVIVTADGGYSANCNVSVQKLITVKTAPIYPLDKTEVANEIGIDPNSLEAHDKKVFLKKELAETIAKHMLLTDTAKTYILPVFNGIATSRSQVAAVSFMIKGSDLFTQQPENVNLVGIALGKSGRFLNYVNSESEFENGKFTILYKGSIFNGKIEPAKIYELVVFVRDGSIFDLDGHVNGKVTASKFITSVKTEKGKGGGCNTGCGYLAFALLGVSFVVMKGQ
jgi:hypothetical protein